MSSVFVDPNHSEIAKSHRHLPHWTANCAVYFVTFRTADSLPASVQESLKIARRKLSCLSGEGLFQEKRRLSKLLNDELDRSFGSCLLRNDNVALIVVSELEKLQEEHIELFGWCIMPNHVHAIIGTKPNVQLSDVLHLWKGRSARAINKLEGRSGKFWQDESFDHLVRSGEKLLKFARYIELNPVRAGLKDWKWLFIREDVRSAM